MMRHIGRLILVLACILPCGAAEAQTPERCAPLDDALVPYDGGETPFAVEIAQPEGWSSLSAMPGKSIDFFLGDSEMGSDFLFRFNALGPMELASLRAMWASADPDEISEIEMENGDTLAIRRPPPYISLMAIVPLPGGSQGVLINGAVVQAPNACDEQALEALDRIIRTVRPHR